MIIGKNTNLQANKNQFVNKNNNQAPGINPMIENTRTMQHTDVTNKNEMHNKAYSILEDRLNKGLITMEEFNKKCAQIGKRVQ